MNLKLKKDKTIVDTIEKQGKELQPELKELVEGRRTMFSILSYTVGSVLIGNVLYRLLDDAYGGYITMIIGFVLFITGGLIRKKFKR